MVNEKRYNHHEGAPPPMDESWWQAILSDDETVHNPLELKPIAQLGKGEAKAQIQQDRFNSASLDWEEAFRLYKQDQIISMRVTGHNRGGLLVEGGGLQGFVPVSHLVELQPGDPELEERLKAYLNQVLRLKVIECDQDCERVVFSERAALAEPGRRIQLLHGLKPGDCIAGDVTNITDFGIFVDLGGVEGLVHVSEISWGRVHHPADAVAIGQQVEVYVIQVDQERARVALSLKRLHPNPWDSAEERYIPGQVTEAVITSVVPFGAFARLEEGLDGLIHISELNREEGGARPESALKEGQRVKVRILHVDASRQRLGLSLFLDTEAGYL